MLKELEAAAPSLRLQPITVAVRSRGEDLGNAFAEIASVRADALFVSDQRLQERLVHRAVFLDRDSGFRVG